ncbi:hypothetical protein ACFWBR_39790 [Streptomyces sp. NPDC060006]|uniref:hypothetical protein n=1 Tax=unclassified Streptomyces TaxID=2593676 RepID=UPI0036990415
MQVWSASPRPRGTGAPAKKRLTAFGCALIERIATDTDLGTALARQLPRERRYFSKAARAYHRHVSTLLYEPGVDGDHEMLAHALLTFVNIDTVDHLRHDCDVPVARLQATWADLVRRMVPADIDAEPQLAPGP